MSLRLASSNDPSRDREPRLITADVAAPIPMRIVSVYAPHGPRTRPLVFDYKLPFLDAPTDRIAHWLDERHVVVDGGVNVAAADSASSSRHVRADTWTFTIRTSGAGTALRHPVLRTLTSLCAERGRDASPGWNQCIGNSRNLSMRLDHWQPTRRSRNVQTARGWPHRTRRRATATGCDQPTDPPDRSDTRDGRLPQHCCHPPHDPQVRIPIYLKNSHLFTGRNQPPSPRFSVWCGVVR